MEALMALENIIRDEDVTRYFKVSRESQFSIDLRTSREGLLQSSPPQQQSEEGHLPKLFKEAVQYVLPRALHEPIYHYFYYCNMLSVSPQ